ncbi:CHAT domain-containing protein [Chroococcus sp. FPU101]|uniref:nSTAND1 domain-containing NTPase n=1 Tax=Chroococcus sp. FPU101 TaxID=1974212 RepID=UPI001AA66C8F|nr:CHAT domain-containing protein [Chroococcus sp. FPU101]GFE71067.1 WD-repeat protein [Chroococcus sp. FPU101]
MAQFRRIFQNRPQLRSHFNRADSIQVIIETDDDLVKRLPWHHWDFVKDYPASEIALSRPEYKRQNTAPIRVSRQNIRILAILGDSQDIDVEGERKFLNTLEDAQTEFLVLPSRLEFDRQLWDSQGWDILFFAGHSHSEEKTGRIYINENSKNNSLTIEQLEESLTEAIANGLKLAIFNSCDGLGLANALSKLNIPVVIVMREPVPNRVAQEFFNYFLEAFAIDRLSLPIAVRQARRKLQALEDQYPSASWLPILCQNPAVKPPTWLQLGGIPPCPYRGLFAFIEEDAHLFFGREKFVEDLVAAVTRKPLVAVIGSSGSGKSSVVFAGLVPKLRQERQIYWHIVSFRPGINPFASLATAFSSLESPQFLEKKLRDDDRALSQMLESFLFLSSSTLPCRLLLIADQFEELYTLSLECDRQSFLNLLLNAVKCTPGFTLVLTLRADFYGRVLTDRPLSDVLQGATQNLGPMSQEELRSAIEKPAARYEVELEPGLTDKLIDAVWEQSGRLPLLEFALTQLWSKQQDSGLTYQAYTEIGGVESALANHAEAAYAQLSEIDRQRMQQVFIQLVQLGEGAEVTRRLATPDEVKPENWDLVTRLADARLVVTNRNCNESTGSETVEIVHEALIRSWGRLGNWLLADGEFRRWQEQLRASKRQWENNDKDQDALLRGKSLADAQYWQSQRLEELSSEDRWFIELSLDQRDQESKAQKRRRKLTVSALISGLVIALLLAGIALWQWHNSAISEIAATSQSSKLLSASHQEFEALLEGLQAGRKLQNIAWTENSPQLRSDVMSSLKEAIYGVRERNRLIGHQDRVYSISFSPDGQIIASASGDQTIKLWKRDGTLLKTIPAHEGEVYDVIYSPDGQIIASASGDKTIKIWNRDGTLLKTLTGHQGEVYDLAFSPDGQIIASASGDKTIKIWNRDGTLLKTLTGHQGEVYNQAFSPDGQIIASASGDKTIKLWNRDGTLLNTVTGFNQAVRSVNFSPDNQKIVASSEDGTIQYLSKDGKLIHRFFDGNIVYRVIFSPDGYTLISVGGDTTVKLWNLDGSLLQTFYGHTDGVLDVATSNDGKAIASASADGTIKIWERDGLLLHTLYGHDGEVYSAVFSPDHQIFASVSSDGTVKLWKRDGTLIKTLQGHTDVVHSAIFSPDGQTLASASWDKTIKLWSRDGTLLTTLEGHNGKVYAASFSPDGQLIASASSDGTVKLWKRDGTLIKTLQGHTDVVHSAIFSPDGQLIASASHDQTVKLWSRDGQLLNTLKGHTNWVHEVNFSPDGQTIASASHDRTVKLWNREGQLLRSLIGHTDKVLGANFSPDGQTVASASRDKTIKLWRLDGTPIATLRGHGNWVHGINFSRDGQTLASASYDHTIILWNLENLNNLNELLVRGCNWMQDYLKNNPNGKKENTLCDGISTFRLFN